MYDFLLKKTGITDIKLGSTVITYVCNGLGVEKFPTELIKPELTVHLEPKLLRNWKLRYYETI